MSEPVEDYAARLAAEYGQYVANGPIYVNGSLAYADGHPVPVSNVVAHGYLADNYVRKVGEAPPMPEPPAPLPVGEPIVINPVDDPAGAVEQHEPDADTDEKD